ncbi:unnamed protein product [Soboliphyme baturini]|uniref:Uncharacterized protein n=1 Tax=Soboliphyme baturini TaxID=241478 RepID=A0A183IQS4_9BILA|nr:unnamed protein product [Soboliphyme baturini]
MSRPRKSLRVADVGGVGERNILSVVVVVVVELTIELEASDPACQITGNEPGVAAASTDNCQALTAADNGTMRHRGESRSRLTSSTHASVTAELHVFNVDYVIKKSKIARGFYDLHHGEETLRNVRSSRQCTLARQRLAGRCQGMMMWSGRGVSETDQRRCVSCCFGRGDEEEEVAEI